MTWFFSWRACVLLLAAAAASACGGAQLTPPTTPTPVPTAEVFADTLGPNSARVHPFTALAGGTITATLTTLSPDNVVGIDLGTWNGIACQIVIANSTAVVTSTLTGTASAIGNFCVRIYDVGKFTEATRYELTVVHP